MSYKWADAAGERVLLVEDDRVTADMYRMGLEMSGCIVAVAADGLTALRLAVESGKADVIVLDLGLPHLDGLKVLSALRHLVATSETPVIVLSNRTDDFPAALAAGAIQCLSKVKTTPADLVSRVHTVAVRYQKGA